jgi:hypothetical protein
MNKLAMEQLNAWGRRVKYYEYAIDKKCVLKFGFIRASWGYGHIRMSHNTKIQSQERSLSF